VQRVEPATAPHLSDALDDIVQGRPTAVAQVVEGPPHLLGRTLRVGGDGATSCGTLDGGRTDRAVTAQAGALLRSGRTARVELGGDADTCPDRLSLLVHVAASRPRMLIFGAVDFAAALAQAGRFLGYHVTVCDARPVFATRTRFPEADDVVVDWPHRYLRGTATDARTVLCVLTHDAKFDVPLLEAALRMPAAFVGALGSRRTHADRERRLREAGLTDGELARLRSPIGLDLGARTPEETALSIAAEIVATRRGGTGTPLTGSGRPIHHEEETHGAGASSGPRARSAVPLRSSVPSLR
jgi:xanthine dehydrogenase accessory factor